MVKRKTNIIAIYLSEMLGIKTIYLIQMVQLDFRKLINPYKYCNLYCNTNTAIYYKLIWSFVHGVSVSFFAYFVILRDFNIAQNEKGVELFE